LIVALVLIQTNSTCIVGFILYYIKKLSKYVASAAISSVSRMYLSTIS